MLMSLKYQFPNDSISYNIEMFGELVIQSAPLPPPPPWEPSGPYYIRFSPTGTTWAGDIGAGGNIEGHTYFNNTGYFSFPTGYLGYFHSSATVFTDFMTRGVSYLETNAYSIDVARIDSWTLTNLSLSECLYIGGSSLNENEMPFRSCELLSSVYIPVCEEIGYRAFQGCKSLTNLNAPKLKYVYTSAFNAYDLEFDIEPFDPNYQAYLTYIYIPECEEIGFHAFAGCKFSSIYLPECTLINDGAFFLCRNLRSVDLPSVSFIGRSAFRQCYSLSSVHLGPSLSVLRLHTFYSCSSLSYLRLDYSSVVELYDVLPDIFHRAAAGLPGYSAAIYVPSSQVSAYKADLGPHLSGGWGVYSTIIYPIPS